MLGLDDPRTRSVLTLLVLLAAGLVAAGLAGCSGSGSGTGFAFGKAPESPQVDPNLFPAKYKSEIADFMRTSLSNPTKVKDAFISQPVLKPVAGTPHYIACVRYNPRDSKNQYTGNEQNVAIFLSGRLNQFLPDDPQMCAGLAYQRYPEIESMVP